MLSKGLDFDNVGLVAVLNCDTLLNQPDYRSSERAFQMLEQVSGRSGRKQQRGQVIIQTTNPDNEVLKLVVSHDYRKFYEQQIAERRLFRYPPFFRLICVMVSDKSYDIAVHAAQLLQSRLKQVFSHRCSGVIEPVVSRVQNRFQRQIILKFEQKEPIARAKQMLSAEIRQLLETDGFKSVRVYADVDV
jgi:primosomal protein N' (replication factor Y)